MQKKPWLHVEKLQENLQQMRRWRWAYFYLINTDQWTSRQALWYPFVPARNKDQESMKGIREQTPHINFIPKETSLKISLDHFWFWKGEGSLKRGNPFCLKIPREGIPWECYFQIDGITNSNSNDLTKIPAINKYSYDWKWLRRMTNCKPENNKRFAWWRHLTTGILYFLCFWC